MKKLNFKFLRNSILPLSVFSFYLIHNKFKNIKNNCFNELDKDMQKQILKNKTSTYIWGKGLANNSSDYNNYCPHKIIDLYNFIDVKFNQYFGAGIDRNFKLFFWVEPFLISGEDLNYKSRNNIVELSKGHQVKSVRFTKDRLFFLNSKGQVYFYKLIIEEKSNGKTFIKQEDYSNLKLDIDKNNLIHIKELKDIVQIETGLDHVIFLSREGSLYGMGDDSYGIYF